MSERRRGFALLMVLVALAMLATVLTLRTRQMMERSLVWDVQAREVQTRWAQRSVAEALAPHALALLGMDKKSAAARQRPRAVWGTTIALGPVSVEVQLTDEQAKLNLLTLNDAQDVRRALVGLAGRAVASRVRLRPLAVPPLLPADDGTENLGRVTDYLDDAPGEYDDGRLILINRPGQYLSFGQVLDHPQAGELMGAAPGRGLASGWTLWGNGRLNMKTADPAVVRVMLSFGVEEQRIQQILVAARKTGGRVERLMDSLPSGDEWDGDEYASNRMMDTSEVQGLWVRARSVGGGAAGGVANGSANGVANGVANESSAFYLIEGPGRPRRVQTW